ncbi:serine/threonine-protein kinase [Actinomadura sediminis]|uniref:Serine/threonine-protein kinase n=1 Tax=Actinomadura sediminis TaxID=1038904 RepID=A0ABW3ES39_9ACTN
MEELHTDDPRQVGAYQLLARLGAGGMGSVFLGRAPSGRTVAVKFVHAELARDADFRRRFRQEVEAARRVSGPWTAPVLDADTDSETPWVATGYVAGPTLQETVAELYGPLPEHSVRALAAGLAEALREIHDRGLIHRDLKPSNVMLTLDGPRVIDFGIARATDGTMITRTGAVVGTPGFMSPEQVRGERVTAAGDVFSLGAVLAYAATGRQPFDTGEASVPALLYRVATEPPNLDGMTGELRDLAERCMAKDPGGRPSPAEIAAAMEATESGSWLPGALVEHVGRRAVQLLELERGDDPPAPGPTTAEPATPAPTTPAPEMRSQEPPPGSPWVHGGPGHGAMHPGTPPPGAVPPGTPPPGTYPPGTYPPGAYPPGTHPPGPVRHRRRNPAAVPLAIAGAAVIVTLIVLLSKSFSGSDDEAGPSSAGATTGSVPRAGGNGEPSGGASSPPASSPPASDDEDAGAVEAGPVPAAFIGTWEGEVSGDQTRRMVIEQGEKGTDIVTTRTTGPNGYCEGKGKMVAAAPNVLEVTTRVTKSVPSDLCASVGRQSLVLQDDGTLKWKRSKPSLFGGGPYTLHKIGG